VRLELIVFSRLADRRHYLHVTCAAQVRSSLWVSWVKTDSNRTELGDKEIYQVHVVSDQNSLKKHQATELHMFFLIRDVPPSKLGELD